MRASQHISKAMNLTISKKKITHTYKEIKSSTQENHFIESMRNLFPTMDKELIEKATNIIKSSKA